MEEGDGTGSKEAAARTDRPDRGRGKRAVGGGAEAPRRPGPSYSRNKYGKSVDHAQ
ncbi:hypothetical protein LG52_3436 [Geobacillus kaustophilus]|uniref:Uncharacterized protein n=1 Tax=Geobacillus kaustophilus TaxID=1462 RepID=A0A0D8BZC1_GEOKU|nr:hypothetical protein LG52_3436 [Geobacillus kaustophilus]